MAITRAASTGVLPAHHPVRAAVREAALLGALMVAYSQIRLVASDDVRSAVGHARGIVRIEQLLHLDVEATLNRALQAAPGLEVLASYWYAALHYTVTPLALVLLYRHRRADYPRARTALVAATAAALVVYVALPTAPPRLVAGYTDVLAATSHVGWWGSEGSAVRGAGGAVNQFAAMPSMHVGWALWCGLVFWRLARTRAQRVLAVAYPTGTALVVLSTANHWLLDVLAGAALVAVAWALLVGRAGARTGPAAGNGRERQVEHLFDVVRPSSGGRGDEQRPARRLARRPGRPLGDHATTGSSAEPSSAAPS